VIEHNRVDAEGSGALCDLGGLSAAYEGSRIGFREILVNRVGNRSSSGSDELRHLAVPAFMAAPADPYRDKDNAL